MRILRGQSTRDVSASGFALFVAGLVFATFLGGAVRTLLRSDQVQTRVSNELKARLPKQVFTIGRTEVLLSRGIWPALGLRLNDVSVRQETCGKLSFLLQVPQMIMPVDLFSLMTGRVRLGHVEIASGHLHIDFKGCESAEAPLLAKKSTTAEAVVAKPKWITAPPNLNWMEASEHVDGVDLSNLTITYEKNDTWKLNVRHAIASLSDQLSFHAQVDVQKSLPFGSLSHLVDVEAQSEDATLQWLVHSEFKEGWVSWKGNWDLAHNAYVTQLQMQQVPLKDVMSELHLMGLIEREVQLKATWLSCSSTWEGQAEQGFDMPVKIRDCKLEGAYGQASLESADVYPWANEPLKLPLRVDVMRLQLQPLLEALNRQLLPAVLPRLGAWTGKAEFGNLLNWSLDGVLENIEIVFSNQSVRGKQLLNKVHIEARRAGGLVAVKMDRFDLQDGKALGQVDFALSEDWRNGSFNVNLSEVLLSPNVQGLLVGGQIQALNLLGSGNLTGGELRDWNGKFDLVAMNGSGWTTEGWSVKSRYLPGVFVMDARLATLNLDNKWYLFRELQRILPQDATSGTWKDISAHFEVKKGGGQLQLHSAQESSGRHFRGKGTWVRDGQLLGQLTVAGLGKNQAFAVAGQNGLIQIQPESEVPR